MIFRILKLSSLILVPLFFTAETQAMIYKCVNTNADISYIDKPCPVTDKESQIKSVKDPEGGYIPPEFISENENTAKGAFVGSTSKSSINKSQRKISEKSFKSDNKSGSISKTQSSSSSNKRNLNDSSRSKSNNNSAVNKGGNTNYPVKNVIRKEGYYKSEK